MDEEKERKRRDPATQEREKRRKVHRPYTSHEASGSCIGALSLNGWLQMAETTSGSEDLRLDATLRVTLKYAKARQDARPS